MADRGCERGVAPAASMSWEDRKYSQGAEYREESAFVRRLIPPRATLALIALQFVGWIIFSFVGIGHESDPSWFLLVGDTSRPSAIALHALAATGPVQMLVVLLAIWSLGARVEENTSAARMLATYAAGNLLAGAAYFAFGRLSPALSTFALVAPLGALAAWSATAWQWQRYEAFSLFGVEVSVRRLILFAVGIMLAMALLQAGGGALAWIVAIAAGAAGGPLVEWGFAAPAAWAARRRVRSRDTPIRHKPARTVASGPAAASVTVPGSAADDNVDAILVKISRSGIASLSEQEKALLEAARQSKLRQASGSVR